ncbi:hypothetical protein [Streptomyces ureilyticus]|uniref:Secreted protein n=1 Tax=Streptomyces ureilyticus TaxID=1775131 RepID=A0ABX0DZV2_9ACTN|nr:hypothetical protein [Streptomyces ureilyticus]NGO44522.1 hypothetical protein [Streptomyces ureilyticus]
MAALAWLLIPLLAAIGAGLWGTWVGRNRRTIGDGVELAGYMRFREAMEKPQRAKQPVEEQHMENSPTDA